LTPFEQCGDCLESREPAALRMHGLFSADTGLGEFSAGRGIDGSAL